MLKQTDDRLYQSQAGENPQDKTFTQPVPGFFAQPGYLILLLVLLGMAPALAVILSIMGLIRNGQDYPRKYGVYYPFYFWCSAFFALFPTVSLLLSAPVG